MVTSTMHHHHGAWGRRSPDRQNGVTIRARLQNDVCSDAVPWGSSRSSQAVVREAGAVHAGQQGARLIIVDACRPWHRGAPTAGTTATTAGLSPHRKERYGTLQ